MRRRVENPDAAFGRVVGLGTNHSAAVSQRTSQVFEQRRFILLSPVFNRCILKLCF
jgi:hypothetical protein